MIASTQSAQLRQPSYLCSLADLSDSKYYSLIEYTEYALIEHIVPC